MSTTINTRNAYVLAHMADVPSPDRLDSPGAKFLLGVADDLAERYDDGPEGIADYAHEIADGAVPIYNHELWATFVDLGAWSEEVDEYGPVEDMTKGAQVALYLIAERLVYALLEELATDEEQDG